MTSILKRSGAASTVFKPYQINRYRKSFNAIEMQLLFSSEKLTMSHFSKALI